MERVPAEFTIPLYLMVPQKDTMKSVDGTSLTLQLTEEFNKKNDGRNPTPPKPTQPDSPTKAADPVASNSGVWSILTGQKPSMKSGDGVTVISAKDKEALKNSKREQTPPNTHQPEPPPKAADPVVVNSLDRQLQIIAMQLVLRNEIDAALTLARRIELRGLRRFALLISDLRKRSVTLMEIANEVAGKSP